MEAALECTLIETGSIGKETGSIGKHTVKAMAPSNARSQIKKSSENRYKNFVLVRSQLAAALFTVAIIYLGGSIVLSCLLGVGNPAMAQTAPSLDANGWTVFTPTTGTGACGNSSSNYTGTCIVYVSNSTGSDTGCAAQAPPVTATPTAPCKTINAGINLLRTSNGGWGNEGTSADWLLLKAGDTFNNQHSGAAAPGENFAGSGVSGGPTTCGISGVSSSQPFLISSYGTGARPLVEANPGNSGAIVSGGQCGSSSGNNIAIVGIEFYAYTRDPSNPNFNPTGSDINGTTFLNPITWMLIENCKFSFFSINIDVDSGMNTSNGSNVSIRRNIITDAYATDEHSQGIYVNMINNLLIQENVLDHNGWNATVSGAGATVFNHNIYLTGQNGPVAVIGNINSNTSGGDQFRSGGTITDNTYIRDPYGHNIGQPYSGVQTLVNNNVHIEQVDNTVNGGAVVSTDTINTFSSYEGQAFNLGTATYSGNIIVHSSTPNTNGGGINIDPGQVDSVLSNNIACNWMQDGAAPSGVLIYSRSSSTLTGNYQDVSDCDHNNYPSPDLTVGTYDTSLNTGSCGGNTVGTTANFICKARQQGQANWSNALMAHAFNTYIRAGFGITSSSSTTTPAVTTPSADTTPPSVPTGLAGTLASAPQINLSWNASTDNVRVTGYNVFRNGTKVGTSTSTSYQDTSLAAGTTYTYAVSAYDAAGNTSAQSSSVSITTPAAPTVAISSPANGTVLKGKTNVNIAASASDGGSSVASISINAGGKTLKTCTNATSCSTSWQTESISRGTQVISATATNTFGQKTSASVTIVSLR